MSDFAPEPKGPAEEAREPVWLPAIVLAIGMGVIGAALVELAIRSVRTTVEDEPTAVAIGFGIVGVAAYGCVLGYGLPDCRRQWWLAFPAALAVVWLSAVQGIMLCRQAVSADPYGTALALGLVGQLLLLHSGVRRGAFLFGIGLTILFSLMACVTLFVESPAGMLVVLVLFGMPAGAPLVVSFVIGAALRLTIAKQVSAVGLPAVTRLFPRRFGLKSIFTITTAAAVMAAVLGQARPGLVILFGAAVAVDIGLVIGIVAADVIPDFLRRVREMAHGPAESTVNSPESLR